MNFSTRTISIALLWLWALLGAGHPVTAGAEPVAQLSFGRVMPNEPVEEVISFNNPTKDILEIEEIKLTPPLLAEDITPFILPGAEGTFRLVLGPERNPGGFIGQVQIVFKGAARSPITLEVEGFVVPPIEFQPFPAFFVATHAGKHKSASIEILNHRNEPLFLKPPKSASDRYALTLETIEEGQHYRLSLTLDGSKEPGEKTDEIILHAEPPLAEPLKVQVNTRIKEPVYHFPDSIDMGALPLEVAKNPEMVKTLGQILMVYRPGTDDFEVEASIDLDYIHMISERGPGGDRYQMDLTLIPEKVKPGKIEGTVSIRTNDKDYPALAVQVTGYILD